MSVNEFEAIYERNKDTVFRIAFTYMKNRQESEDVLQEVFLKLYTAEPVFDSKEHERRWLIRVTVNLCKNRLKLFWNTKRCSLDEIGELADRQDDREIIAAVLGLPEKYRSVVYLHYVEGYRCREIAELLSLKESTVKMRLKRGRELLKLQWEGEEVLI